MTWKLHQYMFLFSQKIFCCNFIGARKLGFEASFAIDDEYKELGGILAGWLFSLANFPQRITHHRESTAQVVSIYICIIWGTY